MGVEARVFGRYLMGEAPSDELATRYARACATLLPRIEAATPARETRDEAVVRIAVTRPWTLGCLEAACALGRPDALLRRKLLIMAAVLEAAPDRAEWFIKDRTGAAEAVWVLALAGLRSGARVFIGGILLAFVRGGRG